MNLFGLTITRKKALNAVGDRGWLPMLRESFAGAWQKDVTVNLEDSLSYWPVFRCISLISSDIAKLGLDLVEEIKSGVPAKVQKPAFSPVLKKPNRYQTRVQFVESWVQSKLSRGNTYVLKERDRRGVVVALYVLDPGLCQPLVSDDGSVFYKLSKDNMSGIGEEITVPSSEIIHDRWNCLYHPLVGLTPIYATAMKAGMALRIQKASANFFENGAQPSGILTAPATIPDDTAKRLKEHWSNNYSGENAGKVAVLGDGLKFEQLSVNAQDAQLIEQLKWSAEAICGAFGVPLYMVVGTPPTYNNVQALTQQYYSQCLQILIESIEILLDEGLALPRKLSTQFDLDALLRMDTATMVTATKDAVGAGVMSPDEGRRKLGLAPVPGGNTPYLQQQNYSLAALDRRDRSDDPFGKAQSAPEPAQDPQPDEEERFFAVAMKTIDERLAHVA